MTKHLTPREKELRSLARNLAELEQQIANDRRRGREIPAYARGSVKRLRGVIRVLTGQNDEQFAAWKIS